MGKKRKFENVNNGKENNAEEKKVGDTTTSRGPMYTIMSNAQLNETLHKRYVKELKQFYAKIDHDAFMYTFIKMLKTVLEAEESNEYGNTSLLFCAKFVTSFESEVTHPVLQSTLKWLLSTISNSPHVRFRICYFVNLILKQFGLHAALDDEQCDRILDYMLDRLRDVSAGVRKQAVLAMQRLQVPTNPDDPVLRAYQFHLSSDPSPNVRQCVVSCMGRNYHTIPHILDRLWDIDEKVRRHTYVNLCNYPVRSYKLSERIILLEQGLNDSSENVRKTVKKFVLKQWIESYQGNLIALTAALKLDSTEEEMQRFRKVTKQMLRVIFEQKDNIELLDQLPLLKDCEMHNCVPLDQLTVEIALYWQCLNEYLQESQADEYELVVPELSIYCKYVEKFSQIQRPDMDNFEQMEFQYMMLSLIEILYSYDLGDEIGRRNMKTLFKLLLKSCLLDHKIVELIVRCTESLITDINERFQYFMEIINDICELNVKQNELVHDRNLISKLMVNADADLQMKILPLKVKILDLEELVETFNKKKDYESAQQAIDEKSAVEQEFMKLLEPLMEKHGIASLPNRSKISKQESTLKGLYITFYMVVSEKVHSLVPSSINLYNFFICRHLASNETCIREWAIKCGTAFSMLHTSFAKEVFEVLCGQFFNSTNLRIWDVAVNCVFELLDCHGIDFFTDKENQLGGKNQNGRTLYNILDHMDDQNDVSCRRGDFLKDLVSMMSHFLDTCDDLCIIRSIVKGFCRLILNRRLMDRYDIFEKLLKIYFNSHTDTSINQILGVFFEHLVELKLQYQLQPCLLPLLLTIMYSNFDSPLQEISPEILIRFVIDITQQETSSPNDNIHNKIAHSFLLEMHNNLKERKELCKILAKELVTLNINVGNNTELKEEMILIADKLIKAELDARTVKNIINFKSMLDGVFKLPLRKPECNESDEDGDSETVTTNSEYANTNATESDSVSFDVEDIETEGIRNISTVTYKEPAAEVTLPNGDNVTFHGVNSIRRSVVALSLESNQKSFNNSDNRHKITNQQKIKQVQVMLRRNLRENLIQAQTITNKSTIVEEQESTHEINESAKSDKDEFNSSDVIRASPNANIPNKNERRLRSATYSQTATAVTNNKQYPAIKTINIHITPLRNGRKRVLRKSPKSRHTSTSNDIETSVAPISPLRKQQRIDKLVNENVAATVSISVLASPTGSTSSVKENKTPMHLTVKNNSVQVRAVATSESVINRSINNTPQTQSTTIITRNLARKERLNAMCMTRKRLLIDMNTSNSDLTPKRLHRENTKSTGKKKVRNVSLSSETKPDGSNSTDVNLDAVSSKTNKKKASAVATGNTSVAKLRSRARNKASRLRKNKSLC